MAFGLPSKVPVPNIPSGKNVDFNLAGKVKDLKNNILGYLGFSDSKTYPTTIAGRDIGQYTNQPPFNDGAWKDSKGYAFAVVRANPQNNTYQSAEGWQEFRLQINPQELTQDEIFAIEVTPTFRGVLVEHHGTILKDISISGTTGISPRRVEAGVRSDSGAPILRSGHSGYEEFHELRSFFRAYVEAKRLDFEPRKKKASGEVVSELRMVFKNLKDCEEIFVEPQRFSMKRSSGRPLLYDYTIQLKGIGIPTAGSEDSFTSFIGSLYQMARTAMTLIQYGKVIFSGKMLAVISQWQRDFKDTVLGPFNELYDALTEFTSGKGRSAFTERNITRQSILSLKAAVESSEQNFNDAIGRDTTKFNEAAGRTSTLSGTPGRQTTYQEHKILNGLQAFKKSCKLLLTDQGFFQDDLEADTKSVQDSYKDKLTMDVANSTKQSRVLGSDTIQTIAARELGDPDRFKEIVVLNNLRPPYISEEGGRGILKAGDTFLLPQSSASADTGIKKNIDYQITRFLQESEKNLGVDIRLDNEYDLAISNTGDLDLIAGITNMAQAILLKIYYEHGSLKRHPEVGSDLQVGRKSVNLTVLRTQLIQSLNSDLRIESIPYVTLEQEGGTVNIELVIRLKNLNQPIPVPLQLNVA